MNLMHLCMFLFGHLITASAQCVDESPIPPTVPPSSWTAWYSVDDPWDGTDDETHAAVQAAFPAVCDSPTLSECRVKFLHTDHLTAGQILATSCSATGGLLCRQTDQTNLEPCLDYEIRFECPSPIDMLPLPHFYWDLSTKTSIDADEPVTCEGPVSSIYPNIGGMAGSVMRTMQSTDGFDSSDHLCAAAQNPASPANGYVDFGSMNDKCMSEPACCTSGFTMSFWMRNRIPPTDTRVRFILSIGAETGKSKGFVVYLNGGKTVFAVRGYKPSEHFELYGSGAGFPDSNQWSFCTFTFELDAGLKYYKNGVLEEYANTARADGAKTQDRDNLIMFSRSWSPSNYGYFPDVDMSDFKMFYRFFNATEVHTLYLQDTQESKLAIHYLRKHSHNDSFGVELECLAKAGTGPPTITWHRSDDGANFEPVSPSVDVAIYESSPNSYRRRSVLIVRHLRFTSDVIFACEAHDAVRGGRLSRTVTVPQRTFYWTPWLSADIPEDGNDRELLELHRQANDRICKYPSDIQCRTVYDGVPSNQTGQILNINCTVASGLECLGSDQSANAHTMCYDYAVRYKCSEPPFYWTPWYDASTPDGTMEDETFTTHTAQSYPDLCVQPIGAECRVKSNSQYLLASGVVPDVPYLCNANGFRCQYADNAGSCPDVEVRYRCPVSDSPGDKGSTGLDLSMVNVRQLEVPRNSIVSLECSVTMNGTSPGDHALAWAWFDPSDRPAVAVPFTEEGSVMIVENGASAVLTVDGYPCSVYAGKTIACVVRDGITQVVKSTRPYFEVPSPVLLAFWELSGRASPDEPDPTSCSTVSTYSFPSTSSSNHETTVIGHVAFTDAPNVADHSCAVLSDTDGALNLGSYGGECLSSPDLCACGVTFALWVMTFEPGELTSDWFLLSSGGQSSSAHGVAFYLSASDQSYRMALRTSTKSYSEAVVVHDNIPKETWFHLALVYNNNEGIKVYVNGTEVAASNDFQTELKNDEQTSFVVGGANSFTGFSKAAFSDLKVYAGAMNQSQISDVMTCNSLNSTFEITKVRQWTLPPDSAINVECQARGIPAPTLEWVFRDGSKETLLSHAPPSVELTTETVSNCITKSTLRIYTSSGSDSVVDELGMLVCRATHDGQELMHGLQLVYPSFSGSVSVSSPHDIILGDTLQLLCQVSGDKIYTIDWYRRTSSTQEGTTATDELLTPTEGGRYHVTTNITSTSSGESSLEIRSFGEEEVDFGEYICSVNRGLGNGMAHISRDDVQTRAGPSTQHTTKADIQAETTQPSTVDPDLRMTTSNQQIDEDTPISEMVPMTTEEKSGALSTDTTKAPSTPAKMTSEPTEGLSTDISDSFVTDAIDEGDGKDGHSDKTIIRKRTLAWLVPVGVCLVFIGIPGIIVCHMLCKKKHPVDTLDLLLRNTKTVGTTKAKPTKPANQTHPPAHASATPTATPVPSPYQPNVKRVQVQEASDQLDDI